MVKLIQFKTPLWISNCRSFVPRFISQPFEDVLWKRPADSQNFDNLDGLRGLAVLIVLTDHTRTLHNADRGIVGVLIFFVLSGFLLTLPFVKARPVYPDGSFFRSYFQRRLKRIYPLFAIMIFLNAYGLVGITSEAAKFSSLQAKFLNFLNYLTFTTSGGHFWTVTEEVYFYILFPFLVLFNYFILRQRKFPTFIFMCSLAYIWAKYRPSMPFNLEYIPGKKTIFFDAFFVGIACSYATASVSELECVKHRFARILGTATVFIGGLYLCFGNDFFISSYMPTELTHSRLPNVFLQIDFPLRISILSGFIIAALVLNTEGLSRFIFGSTVLRVVGLLSYNMYLVHPHITNYQYLHGMTAPNYGIARFFGVFAATFVISCFTYTFVEKPFMQASRRETPRTDAI